MEGGTGSSKASYSEIRLAQNRPGTMACNIFWVDTCCIDKSNNANLAEAINFMFRWYGGTLDLRGKRTALFLIL
jgi:hypothetical protein